MKKLVSSLALAVVSLLIAFAFGEWVVRLLFKDETVLFPRYHTDYRYGRYALRGIRPNSEYWLTSVDGSWKMVTNDKGFRNTKNFGYDKPPNTIRVLSLGDSHTQGYEVRQDFTYSAVIERYLGRDGRAAEVINTGVSGFSNAEALAFLESEGVKYKPDAVVIGFTANDYEDNVRAGLFALDDRQQLVEKNYEYLPGVRIQNLLYSVAPVRWLSENSYFYSLLFNTVWEFAKARSKTAASRQSATGGTKAAEAVEDVEHAVYSGKGPSPYQIGLAAALIERMHRFCAERGIRLIVVELPRPGTAYRYVSHVPAALVEHFAKSGVEFVSSDSLLGRFHGVAEVHVPHGHRHITELTHLLVGTEVGARLLEQRNTAASR